MKASTKPPDAVEMAPVAGVSDFELYIEKDLLGARRLRLARRWWLPGGGIAVDTGLVLGP